MQLIEIVQLVLVGFIALSLIIFLFSYIGYRTRTKKIVAEITPVINERSITPDLEEKKNNHSRLENVQNSKATSESVDSKEVKKKQNRFEVFKPVKDKFTTHSPKTIISNSSQEIGKKK